MVNPERLRNSYVANSGAIDMFGTVLIVQNAPNGKRRKDHDVRVYSPVLHEYADGNHQAVLEGATLRILFQKRVVATLTYRQLEETGPQLDWQVSANGFIFERKIEERENEIAALKVVAMGVCPDVFNENPRARVDVIHAGRDVVVFWLDDDYAVVFATDGTPIEAVVEYPLARATWLKKSDQPAVTVN